MYLADEPATIAWGQNLAQILVAGGTVFLDGTLGAGKTTLTRGVLLGLGHSGAVKSPTYTLVEPYELAGRNIYHFDLYRLGDPEELEFMGIRDYFSEQNLCIVEWPTRGFGFLPDPDLHIKIIPEGAGRAAQVSAGSERGERLLRQLCALKKPD